MDLYRITDVFLETDHRRPIIDSGRKPTMKKILPFWILSILCFATVTQALQLDPQPGESLLDSAQEGKYLAMIYKSQGFSAVNIRVVNLETESIVYQSQQPYPQSKLIQPVIRENFLVYMTRDEIVRVDLSTGQEQTMPGGVREVTDDGTIVTGDGLVDIATWAVTAEYDPKLYTPQLVLDNLIIFSVKDIETHNPAGYQALSTGGQVMWTLAVASPTQVHLPSDQHSTIRSFPLPVFRYDPDGRWHLEFLDRSGRMMQSHLLTDLDIHVLQEEGREKNWLHNFKVMDDRAGRRILSFRLFTDQGDDDPVRYGLLTDAQANIDTALIFASTFTAGIDPQGNSILISKKSPDQDQCLISSYDADGGLISQAPLSPWITRPAEFRILDGGQILAEASQNLFLKCAVETGQATGLYAFPTADRVDLAVVSGNAAYIFAVPRFKTSPTVDQGTRLLTFPIDEAGWFEIELVKMEPNTGSMDQVYADSDVLVGFAADRSLEKMITVDFEAGQAVRRSGSGLRYDWHTPDEERIVRITASLGPLSRTFDIDVVRVSDALTLDLSGQAKDAYRFIISGEVTNGTNRNIDGLQWEVSTENLTVTSSSLPDRVQANRGRSVTIRTELAVPEDVAPGWNGYTVSGSATVRLDTGAQTFEKTFQASLAIEPNKTFFIRFQDRETGRSLNLKDIDLAQLKIFDPGGAEITSRLVISPSGTKVTVGGLAPGFASRPIRLTAAYLDARAEIELAFKDIRSTGRFSPPTVTLELLSAPLLTVTTLVSGEPQSGITAELFREGDEEFYHKATTGADGSHTFSDLDTGRYTVKLFAEGYVPQELGVDLDQVIHHTKTVEMQRYVAILLKGEAYYKSALTDIIGAEVHTSVNMTEASDHIFILPDWAEDVYFNMLYKIGCPEGIFTDLFEESDYSIEYQVTRMSDSGSAEIYVGDGSFSESDGYEERTEEDVIENNSRLGFSYPAANITRPTLFEIAVEALDKDYDIVVWVFPSNWENYTSEARQVALLYGLKNNLGMLDYGENARDYLISRGDMSNLIASGMGPIINYGVESLGIFGDVPDGTLEGLISGQAESFAGKLAEKILTQLVGAAAYEVFNEIYAILGSIKGAIDWGNQMPDVIQTGTDAVYANSLLEGIANEDANFLQILEMFQTLKAKMEPCIAAIDDNDPALCRTYLNQIEAISVGLHPDSDQPADYKIDYDAYGVTDAGGSGYCLAVLLTLEYNRITEWSGGNGIAPYFGDDLISIPLDDKMSATQAAMTTYGPIWETLFRIAAVFIDAALLGQ